MGARRVKIGEVYQYVHPNEDAGFGLHENPKYTRYITINQIQHGDLFTVVDITTQKEGRGRRVVKLLLHRDVKIYYAQFTKNNNVVRITKCKETSSSSPENTPSRLP